MARWLLRRLFGRIASGSMAVTYWDGETEWYGAGSPAVRLIFRRPLPALGLLADPVLAFGEAYMDGVLELDGRLEELIRLAHANQAALSRGRWGAALLARASAPLRRATLARQARDVRHHYDLGNDFFSLWLDETLTYSCAYFHHPDDSLDQAQAQKIDHVLAKLQLRPGERLLDIGSGWGSLIIRAAQQYGVRATGITLSREQYEETRRRLRAAGLDGLVEVELADYRTLAAAADESCYDKIASVGMFEHVGRENYRVFMRSVQRLLAPGGLMLLHFISYPVEGEANAWLRKYIFPGGCIPSLREAVALLPEFDFHVLDVESLRLHYARTLDHWAENFEASVDLVRQRYGERFVRMWRLYLLSCAASFRTTGLDVHQVLFSNGLNNSLPLTREHLYREREPRVVPA